jgi:choline kinase
MEVNMSKINYAIIAAAGMGRRLGKDLPKCLIEVNNRKIIEYQLELLKDIKNVVMIVGYKYSEVIQFVKSIRDDVTFLVNSDFSTTTTLQSFFLVQKIIKEKAIFLDGDMILEKKSFHDFINVCETTEIENLIGISHNVFSDPVYVHVKNDNIMMFTRTEASEYEWANLAYINSDILENLPINFYQLLEKNMPLKWKEYTRCEVDTIEDLEYIERNKDLFDIDKYFSNK